MRKTLEDITVQDILDHPVWKFTNSSSDELEVEPVTRTVHKNLDGLLIGSTVTFADGSTHWAMLQNLSLTNELLNDHFLTISIHRGDKWFPLARYHDVTFERYSPLQLSSFMDKRVDDIFPISYDLRTVLQSESLRLVGSITASPAVRLTDAELISLSFL